MGCRYYVINAMHMYQGLGRMLTKCLQHHQGCPETPKSADVICEWPLTSKVFLDLLMSAEVQLRTESRVLEPLSLVPWFGQYTVT